MNDTTTTSTTRNAFILERKTNGLFFSLCVVIFLKIYCMFRRGTEYISNQQQRHKHKFVVGAFVVDYWWSDMVAFCLSNQMPTYILCICHGAAQKPKMNNNFMFFFLVVLCMLREMGTRPNTFISIFFSPLLPLLPVVYVVFFFCSIFFARFSFILVHSSHARISQSSAGMQSFGLLCVLSLWWKIPP